MTHESIIISFLRVMRMLIEIYNNEEWERNMEIILSLVYKMDDAKNLTNLSLLLTCNDLLKIKLIPLEKSKK